MKMVALLKDSCREALDLNVKPRIAIEAMTAALRLP